jgi:ribonucleoside-diphosphate reductase alpha chain
MDARQLNVLNKRIFLKDSDGKVIEDYEGMCKRVSDYLGKTDQEKADFYYVMINGYFLPNSPCLVNAGIAGRKNQLAACFVLGIEDSITSIYDTVKESALIHKTGGGTGFDFSQLRPKDSIVGSTNGVASGPVSFMHLFDASTAAIKQGGVRRGANMGILRVDHPDIVEFINAKRGKNGLQNFNLSVAITNDFMLAVMQEGNYTLTNGESIPAKPIFDLIVASAHEYAEPGIILIDKINEANPLKGKINIIHATNPCGEQPLVYNEACGLGSINLSAMMKGLTLDDDLLDKVVSIGIVFLNRMMEKSEYPNEKIAKRVRASQKIGLGPMGFADMLIKLKIPYNSPDALEWAERVARKILDASVRTTHELGLSEGTFLLSRDYVPPSHIKESLKRLKIPVGDYCPKNSCLTTVAPTGTLSIIAGCSASIEPVFYFEQLEKRLDTELTHLHPLVVEFKAKHPGFDLPSYFQESADVDVDSHIQIQASFQRYVCAGVSKTVVLPTGSTIEDVEKVYKEAYMLGCKGVTVYVDGSLDNQVLSGTSDTQDVFSGYIEPEERPDVITGTTYTITTGYGELFVTINSKDNRPFEVLCQLGKSGGSEMAKAEAIGRLASVMLRARIHPKVIVEQLSGIVGSESVFSKYGLVKSIPDAVAKILTTHILEDMTFETPKTMGKCKGCGNTNLAKEGGCSTCRDCGWTSCGG